MPRLTRPSPVLFLCLFVSQAALLVLSPVLPEVARELGVSTATAGQLRSLSGLTGGATGIDASYRNGFERIRVSFSIKGDAPRETLEAIVERAKARSVVYDMVSNPVPVDVIAEIG